MSETKPTIIEFDAGGALIGVEIQPDTTSSAYADRKTTLVCPRLDVTIADYNYDAAIEKMRTAIANCIGIKPEKVKICSGEKRKGQYMIK